MEYSKEFVEKVKDAFPPEHNIHEAMGAGHDIRRYLEGGSEMKLNPSEIVEAFDDG